MGGFTTLLFLLWFGVTVNTEVDLQKRIIRGRPCARNVRPYHVKIVDVLDQFYCGGSLINERWILTAAHCWQWGLKVVLGVHPGPGRTLIVDAPPEIYRDNNNAHDIMLLKLPYRTQIPHVDLPPAGCTSPNVGANVELSGFGSPLTDANNRKENGQADVLQCANFTVARTGCSINGNEFLNTHIFCGETNPSDTSPGDSGGGAVIGNVIYGVHHGGSSTTAHAGHTISVDVCHYRDWIVNTAIY